MPRRDGTGPEGRGSMTGRGMGYCANFDTPGVNRGYGQGRGMGFGRGRGFNRMNAPIQPQPMSKGQEKQYVTEEIESMRERLSELEQHLKDITQKE